MKVFPILLVSIGLFLLQTTPALGQSSNDPKLIIERIIETGINDGHYSKIIGGMGDPAAVILAKVLADRDLRRQDIVGGLWILADAFAGDQCSSADPGRKPQVAFALLRYFDLSTADADIKKQIAEVRKAVEKNCEHPNSSVEKKNE